MFFTEEDYRKIEKWISQRTVKDTQFSAADSLTGKELVPIVQDSKNKVVKLYSLLKQMTSIDPVDFYNLSDKLKKTKITLKEAISSIPVVQRKVGLVITFEDEKGQWNIYQFRGASVQQWNTINYWENIINNTIKRYIDENLYFPDEEDITGFRDGNRTFIKFKDRHPSEEEFISVGTIILRKNIQGVEECDLDGEGTPVNVLTQDMINEENVIYVIQYDFDLEGETISVPKGSTLWFQGGSLHNGNLYLHDTAIIGAYRFEDLGDELTLLGTFKKGQIMTFHNYAYKAKEGKYFIKTEVPIESREETRDLWISNPDAYVTTERQEIRWWNGEEWVWILDAVDYAELKSIIEDFIEKHNIEVADLYSYIGNALTDIYNEINSIKEDIVEIKVRIGNLETRVTVIEGDIAEINVRLDGIDVKIANINNSITEINTKIEQIETTIENIINEFNDFKVEVGDKFTQIDNKFEQIDNSITEIGDTITIMSSLCNVGIRDNTITGVILMPDTPETPKPDPNPDPVPDTPSFKARVFGNLYTDKEALIQKLLDENPGKTFKIDSAVLEFSGEAYIDVYGYEGHYYEGGALVESTTIDMSFSHNKSDISSNAALGISWYRDPEHPKEYNNSHAVVTGASGTASATLSIYIGDSPDDPTQPVEYQFYGTATGSTSDIYYNDNAISMNISLSI